MKNRQKLSRSLFLVLNISLLGSVIYSVPARAQRHLPPSGLMIELLAHPEKTRILDPLPELSWIVNDTKIGALQTGYQILVSASSETIERNVGEVWDSGRVTSSRSTSIPYGGPPLQSGTTYYWKVRTWNNWNETSDYSRPQVFHTGVFTDEHHTTRYPLEQHDIQPVSSTLKSTGHHFFDFGKAAFGTLTFRTLSNQPLDTIEVHLGEKLSATSTIDRDPGGTIRYRKIPVVVGPGAHEYEVQIPPDRRNTGEQAIKMPADIGEVLPFRYAEIVSDTNSIDLSSVRQKVVHYPFDDQASHFSSSDTVLNAVWEISKYSIKATTFAGVYVDGDRERIPYEADAYINQLGHYTTDREYTLARFTHEYLIEHPTWPTEWILHSVLMAWADYLYTQDAESLAAYYEDLKAKTLWALAREDGLISTKFVPDSVLKAIHFNGELRDIVDWPEGERDGYVMTEINTVVNSFHYLALRLFARIAEVLNHPADANLFHERASRVKDTINTKLFDRERGVYRDGEGTDHVSLHANMFPLAFGIVPEEAVEGVTNFIVSRGMASSVYGAQFLLEALYRANRSESALALLTATSDRSWAHMVYDLGSTITLEAWDETYKPNLDWNHAWGAAPANIIPRFLLGVQPLEPGFSHISIHPQPGMLRFAEGVIPGIRGAIRVSFENDPGKSFTLKVEIPANTVARVGIPLPHQENPSVSMNDQVVSGRIEGAHFIIEDVPSGSHVFIAR